MARPFLLNVAALINRRSKALRNISLLLRSGKKRTLDDPGIFGSEFPLFPKELARIRRHEFLPYAMHVIKYWQ